MPTERTLEAMTAINLPTLLVEEALKKAELESGSQLALHVAKQLHMSQSSTDQVAHPCAVKGVTAAASYLRAPAYLQQQHLPSEPAVMQQLPATPGAHNALHQAPFMNNLYTASLGVRIPTQHVVSTMGVHAHGNPGMPLYRMQSPQTAYSSMLPATQAYPLYQRPSSFQTLPVHNTMPASLATQQAGVYMTPSQVVASLTSHQTPQPSIVNSTPNQYTPSVPIPDPPQDDPSLEQETHVKNMSIEDVCDWLKQVIGRVGQGLSS
jgi:hypothetical protein